jgi:hypothetical protein
MNNFSAEYLLILVKEYGAGAVGWHLGTLQPGPQVLVGLLQKSIEGRFTVGLGQASFVLPILIKGWQAVLSLPWPS